MTDCTIILAENDRASYRGIKRVSEALWEMYMRQDDAKTLVIDYANLLGSETISTVARTLSGTTAAGTSNTTTTTTQRLSGQGYADIQITGSSSTVRTDRIVIKLRSEDDSWPLDYQV